MKKKKRVFSRCWKTPKFFFQRTLNQTNLGDIKVLISRYIFRTSTLRVITIVFVLPLGVILKFINKKLSN